MYVNPAINADELDTSFTQNLSEKIISTLLNNSLPTDPHSEVHITLSGEFTGCVMEREERM